jgi:hypothetical protein
MMHLLYESGRAVLETLYHHEFPKGSGPIEPCRSERRSEVQQPPHSRVGRTDRSKMIVRVHVLVVYPPGASETERRLPDPLTQPGKCLNSGSDTPAQTVAVRGAVE